MTNCPGSVRGKYARPRNGKRQAITSATAPKITAAVAPGLVRRMLDEGAYGLLAPGVPPADARLGVLSGRELEVLEAVGRGLTNAEIARELVLAESTVKKHVRRVLEKTGARDRVQAVIFAYETGLAGAGTKTYSPPSCPTSP